VTVSFPGRRRGGACLLVMLAMALALTPSVAQAKVFPNCKAVDAVYPHGIAKNAHAATHATGLKGRPIVSAKLYAQNSTKDRDHDGVACEH
jgi:hypothetical protein